MTLVTLVWQFVKHATGMAGFAVDHSMLAIQRKTRGKMVKGVDVYVFLFKTEIRQSCFSEGVMREKITGNPNTS
jgi:hypothetical protein